MQHYSDRETESIDLDLDTVQNTILAISFRNQTLGAAFFSSKYSTLSLMQDIPENKTLEFVKSLINQIHPELILIHSKMEDISSYLTQSGIPFEMKPVSDFHYPSSLKKLLSIGSLMGFESVNQNDFYHYLSSRVVDLTANTEMVGSAGALISWLKKNRFSQEALAHSNPLYEIRNVIPFNLCEYLFINKDSMDALQIFHTEKHPNMHNSSLKEGLSLFKLLNHTCTPLGLKLLRNWFLFPSLNLELICSRQDTIAYLVSVEQSSLCDELVHSLKNIKNIPGILERLRKKPGMTDWQLLLKFAFHALKIHDALNTHASHSSLLMNIRDSFYPQELREIGNQINTIVDFDASALEKRFVVKDFVDPHLDELKKTFAGLDDFLATIAGDQSHYFPKEWMPWLNIVYFPQLGFLVSLTLNSVIESIDSREYGLSFQFSTDSVAYFKNDRMRELDDTLGDIHSNMTDIELSIMQSLCVFVLEYEGPLLEMIHACSELDCILSLTIAAKKYGYVQPHMTQSNVLEIQGGRHPLQELCTDTFIGNDTFLGEAQNHQSRMILLTGANSSGKSVYLKQIGLIVYMAHIGSFVPAESAIIGLTDKILTRISTRESIAKSSSGNSF